MFVWDIVLKPCFKCVFPEFIVPISNLILLGFSVYLPLTYIATVGLASFAPEKCLAQRNIWRSHANSSMIQIFVKLAIAYSLYAFVDFFLSG